MAAAHTRVALPVAATWTSIYSASGTKTLLVSNIGNTTAKIRIDASAADSDNQSTVGYALLNPGERMSFGVVSGDKVFGVPAHAVDAVVGLLVQ